MTTTRSISTLGKDSGPCLLPSRASYAGETRRHYTTYTPKRWRIKVPKFVPWTPSSLRPLAAHPRPRHTYVCMHQEVERLFPRILMLLHYCCLVAALEGRRFALALFRTQQYYCCSRVKCESCSISRRDLSSFSTSVSHPSLVCGTARPPYQSAVCQVSLACALGARYRPDTAVRYLRV